VSLGHTHKCNHYEVSDFDSDSEKLFSCDELQNAFNEMYGETLETFIKLSKQKKINAKLEREISQLNNDI
jgi:hypothetical protein